MSDGATEINDWRELLDERAITGLRMIFSSGSMLEVDCVAALLIPEQGGVYVEDWIGAL